MQTPAITKANNSVHPRLSAAEKTANLLLDVLYDSEMNQTWEETCIKLATHGKADALSWMLLAKRLGQVVESLQEVKAELQALKPKS